MKNVYDGVATLDENGQALVQMPGYFEALNQDFRYQLTPIGSFAPLYVAQGVQNNSFLIAGGTPGMQVSWQVTGVRHDPWTEANRQEVEQPKALSEQGKYLYPELYGQPADQAIGYMASPAVNSLPSLTVQSPPTSPPAPFNQPLPFTIPQSN